MPCLMIMMTFFAPRLVIVLVWLFSNFFNRAYDSVLLPALGFFFMPLTTLAYAAAINWHGRVSGMYLLVVIMAALMDLGAMGGGARWHRSRRA